MLKCWRKDLLNFFSWLIIYSEALYYGKTKPFKTASLADMRSICLTFLHCALSIISSKDACKSSNKLYILKKVLKSFFQIKNILKRFLQIENIIKCLQIGRAREKVEPGVKDDFLWGGGCQWEDFHKQKHKYDPHRFLSSQKLKIYTFFLSFAINQAT